MLWLMVGYIIKFRSPLHICYKQDIFVYNICIRNAYMYKSIFINYNIKHVVFSFHALKQIIAYKLKKGFDYCHKITRKMYEAFLGYIMSAFPASYTYYYPTRNNILALFISYGKTNDTISLKYVNNPLYDSIRRWIHSLVYPLMYVQICTRWSPASSLPTNVPSNSLLLFPSI